MQGPLCLHLAFSSCQKQLVAVCKGSCIQMALEAEPQMQLSGEHVADSNDSPRGAMKEAGVTWAMSGSSPTLYLRRRVTLRSRAAAEAAVWARRRCTFPKKAARPLRSIRASSLAKAAFKFQMSVPLCSSWELKGTRGQAPPWPEASSA